MQFAVARCIHGGHVKRRPTKGKRLATVTLALIVIVGVGPLSSCKNNIAQAAAAAKNLQDTAQKLSAYYHDLSQQIDDTRALTDLDASIPKLASPSEEEKKFDEEGRQQLDEARAEIDKRADMADALSKLAGAYAALAGSNAAVEVSGAASGLASACTGIQQIQSLGNLGPIPGLLASATKALVEEIQAGKLKKSARSVEEIMQQVTDLFDHETGGYESINRNRIHYAQTLATQLVKNDMYDPSPLLAPALKPFGLEPQVMGHPAPSSQTFIPDFQSLAKLQIADHAKSQEFGFETSTKNMSASLKATTELIHKIAVAR